MSYGRAPRAPRPTSAYSYRQSSSEEDSHLTSPDPLSPPRPFFLSAGSSDRNSWSADSLEANSDSDRDAAAAAPPVTTRRARNHTRRRSSMANAPTTNGAYSAVDPNTPGPNAANPFSDSPPQLNWTPASLYDDAGEREPPAASASRPPPSSFAYPFQAYPGNPDPIPSRRNSAESIVLTQRSPNAVYQSVPTQQSAQDLGRPYAPFMGGGAATSSPTNSVYSSSAAAGIQRHASSTGLNESGNLPRNSSQTFRAPFLSPASRPSSSLWSPPSYAGFSGAGGPPSPHLSPSVSTSALALALPKPKAPLPSTRLPEKLGKEDKPWLVKKDKHTKIGWWLTFSMILLGLCGAGALAWSGTRNVFVIKDSQLCLVMQDDFDTLDLTNNWSKDIELGGFGNGEFQMTTDSSDNMYINDGQLYIVPTLTSDTLGTDAIFNGGNYTLDNCSTDNSTACSVSSSSDTDTVINPVMSGRLNTKGKVTLQYGKVEIRAKLPTGDWLWPAIWMLPEDNEYGEWPMSGEMDIMEARGNKPSAQGQGTNFVRSSLNYGPLDSLTHTIFGWYSLKRTTLAQGFHTYSVEWTGDFMRFYTDSRLNAMLDLRTRNEKESFWNQAGFPETAQNGSSKVVINNIYSGGANSAPFDKSFYLLIDLAVGGTSGWFPDGVDGKPWYDASSTAMHDFAKAQDTWHATWPSNVNDLAFRIDYVKMWKLC